MNGDICQCKEGAVTGSCRWQAVGVNGAVTVSCRWEAVGGTGAVTVLARISSRVTNIGGQLHLSHLIQLHVCRSDWSMDYWNLHCNTLHR